jgi:uncharacterized membrane protein
MILLPLHIVAGALGILSGAVALYAVKGAVLHRRSGKIFVCAMLVMSVSGAILAALGPNWATVLQAALTFYLVTTGLTTVWRRPQESQWLDVAAMLVAFAIGITHVVFGLEALTSATGRKFGYPPPLFFVFGPLALVAAIGDLRMIRAGGLHGFRRLARHLWRMCVALFIATASFFLGQAKVIPPPLRIAPLLAVLALFPLAVMLYWLVQLRRRNGRQLPLRHAGTVTRLQSGQTATTSPVLANA